MSATLVVAIPLALLGVVALLGFVGCGLNRSGTLDPPNVEAYSEVTVLANPNCVAYWPLWETSDLQPAQDRRGGRNGVYIDQNTAAGLYPWPSSVVTQPAGDILSAGGADTAADQLKLGQPGLLAGDFVQPVNAVLATCMVVNGAYVKVDALDKTGINPASFTVEAWVRVDWTSTDLSAWRNVFDAREVSPLCTGFGLHAKTDENMTGVYHWEAVVGNGGDAASGGFTSLTSPDTIALAQDAETMPNHLAVTYDAATQLLTLFVDGKSVNSTNTSYVPNTTQPLLIGAGVPSLPERPQPPGVLAGPLFPWVGAIQDVAIYDIALPPGVIAMHHNNGFGNF